MRLLLITILGMGSFSLLLCFGLADTARRKRDQDDFAQLGGRPLVSWPDRGGDGEVERLLRVERQGQRDAEPPPKFAPPEAEVVRKVLLSLANTALTAVVGKDEPPRGEETPPPARRRRRTR